MGLTAYDMEPDAREFGAECQWCGRPCRDGEYRMRAVPEEWRASLRGWTQRVAACLTCDAALEGELAPVCGVGGCDTPGLRDDCPEHGVGAYYKRAAARGDGYTGD